MPRPGSRRRPAPDLMVNLKAKASLNAAVAARLQRERRELLLDFTSHLNRTAWESKTDEQLVDEYLEA